MAQLVEHHLAKVRVAGSSPVIRSQSGIHTIPLGVVGWPRGEAAACKAVYTGSNPVPTSGDWRRGSALPSHGRGHWFDPSIAHHQAGSSDPAFLYSPRGVLPLFRCVFSFSPLQLTRPWLRSADTGLWARAGVSVRGGVVVDVSKGATRTAVLRAWPGIRAWARGCVRGAGDLLVGSRMCMWGWGSPCGLAEVHVGLGISLWARGCACEPLYW